MIGFHKKDEDAVKIKVFSLTAEEEAFRAFMQSHKIIKYDTIEKKFEDYTEPIVIVHYVV